ncbi:hypothetical protein VTK26DRAFT_1185 [Humicola hyalothermophila]
MPMIRPLQKIHPQYRPQQRESPAPPVAPSSVTLFGAGGRQSQLQGGHRAWLARRIARRCASCVVVVAGVGRAGTVVSAALLGWLRGGAGCPAGAGAGGGGGGGGGSGNGSGSDGDGTGRLGMRFLGWRALAVAGTAARSGGAGAVTRGVGAAGEVGAVVARKGRTAGEGGVLVEGFEVHYGGCCGSRRGGGG